MRKTLPFTLGVSLLWMFGVSTFAQTPSPFSETLFTVGTSEQDPQGADWAYVTWAAAAIDDLQGQRFAIFAKEGDAASSALFQKVGESFPQTTALICQTMIARSQALGDDSAKLEESINGIFADFGFTPDVSLAEKVAALVNAAQSDPIVFTDIWFLSRRHVSLALCLGVGFATPIAPISSTRVCTFEIRRASTPGPVADDAYDVVIGRVTIDAATPPVLPAPTNLSEVLLNNANGETDARNDRVVRLHWDTPPALARMALLHFGFNIYRMDYDDAVTLGFDNLTQPPTPSELDALLDSPSYDVARINTLPVLVDEDNNYHASDDNDRFQPGGRPFEDGDRFIYFVTALDVLGRDKNSVASNGLDVTHCDRIPPPAPLNITVGNDYFESTSNEYTQRLEVKWTISSNDNREEDERIDSYYVYRFENFDEFLEAELMPDDDRFLIAGPLPHVDPGKGKTSEMTLRDDGSHNPKATRPAPEMPGDAGKTYIYCVRSATDSACGPLYSSQSTIGFGVLRDREGPTGLTGTVLVNCLVPQVSFFEQTPSSVPSGFVGQIPSDGLPDEPVDQLYWAPLLPGGTTAIGGESSVNLFLILTRAAAGNLSESIRWIELSLYPAAAPQLFPPTGPSLAEEPGVLDPEGPATPGAPAVSSDILPGISLGRVYFTEGEDTTLFFNQVARTWPNPSHYTIYMRAGTQSGKTSDVFIAHLEDTLVSSSPDTYDSDESLVFSIVEVNLVQQRVEPSILCPAHDTVDPITDEVVPVDVVVNIPPTSEEIRIYRRVDEGDLSLLTAYTVQPGETKLTYEDNDLPANYSEICYYAQAIDQHGNAGPLTLLRCIEASGRVDLPTPLLAPIESLPPSTPLATVQNDFLNLNGPSGIIIETQPERSVRARWFCPPDGVHHFQLRLGRKRSSQVPIALIGNDDNLFRNNPDMEFVATEPGNDTLETILIYNTPAISNNFGPGPEFSIDFGVQSGVEYSLTVTAVAAGGEESERSNREVFIWTRPVPPSLIGPEVPWPARDLPPLRTAWPFEDEQPDNPDWPRTMRPRFLKNPSVAYDIHDDPSLVNLPVGTTLQEVIDFMEYTRNSVGFFLGVTEYLQFCGYVEDEINNNYFLQCEGLPAFRYFDLNPFITAEEEGQSPKDPKSLVQRVDLTDAMLPLMIYRYQVPSDLFPVVSGDVYQVTPLIRNIHYKRETNGLYTQPNSMPQTIPDPSQIPVLPTNLVFYDPYITVHAHEVSPRDNPPPVAHGLYIIDDMPMIEGAAYRYLIARFNQFGEVVEVIPVDETITVPIPDERFDP